MTKKTIKVDYLARVEGEGALFIEIEGNRAKNVQLKIFEPPRFFEGFLQGRDFSEVPDITARICGICPVAYQMSSVHAMESILGIQMEGALRELRRLLYCGEWIESHGLHLFMLHAPDFLGYPDAIAMAKDHKNLVETALFVKKIGNQIVSTLGGREIHPINVKVGGFYRVPERSEFQNLLENLKKARDAFPAIMQEVKNFEFPDFERDYEFVSLSHEDEYPLNEGTIVSSKGLSIAANQFNDFFEEEHVPYTNALHCVKKDGKTPYFVGPLARYSMHFDKLPKEVQTFAFGLSLKKTCNNPFKSLLVRGVEIYFALVEAIRVIENYNKPAHAFIETKIKAGKGSWATEAPRGLLFHEYEIDESGKILKAQIIPPTSQNQKTIERDLYEYIPFYSKSEDMNDDERLTLRCEQSIRNYDPCISCATHFLKMDIKRSLL